MKLLVATTVPVTIESFLVPFARHFRALGWRVDAMSAGMSASPAAEEFDRVWDVAWSRNPLAPAGLREVGRIRRIVSAEGYDLVHVHTPVAGFLTRLALRDRPAPTRVVYTAHGFHFAPGLHPARNAAFLALEKLAGRWTDALVVINAEDLEAAKRHRLVPEDRLRLVHGIGVDLERFDRDRVGPERVEAVRRELGLESGVPLLTMVAELNANKRHRLVLDALARSRSAAHLALCGTGPLLEDVRRHARALGLEERLHVLGWRDDVDAVLAASVASVLFSAREGLPVAVMESLALGVPVVGADIRGVRDLLEGGSGILVPSGDVEALASAIDAFVLDPAASAEAGRRGRERMAAFSLPSVIAAHERLYEDVLGVTLASAAAERPPAV